MKGYYIYPTKPSKSSDPDVYCASCDRPSLEIAGRLEGHSETCAWRKKTEAERPSYEDLKEDYATARYLLNQIIQSLPRKRYWLDPVLESQARMLVQKGM